MRRLGCVILFLTCCVGAQHIDAQAVPDLKTVLDRTRSYVSAYEEQLGTLIGEEDYKQTAVWDNARPGSLRVGTMHRRLSSDFLLTRVGNEWFGVRNVREIDQKRIDGKTTDFSKILSESPMALAAELRNMNRSSSRYNIGDFTRTFNLPTYPLTMFHALNFGRFIFEKGPEKKIGNVTTWEIRFDEVLHPTMIRDLKGNDQVQHGRLWIDPRTGEIVKTETVIDSRSDTVHARVTFVVSYKHSAKLSMLVLDTMQEKYDAGFHRVDCEAIYSNFRRFETDVKLDIGPFQ